MNLCSKALLELRRNNVDKIEETVQLARELDVAMEGHKFETFAEVLELNSLAARCNRRLQELANVGQPRT